MASAVISLAQLLTGMAGLGFGSGIVRFFFADQEKQKLLNTVLTFTFLSSCLFGAVCVLGLDIWSPSLVLLQQILPFAVFLLLIISTAQNLVFQMVFLSLKKADITFGILTLLNVLRLVFILLFRRIGSGDHFLADGRHRSGEPVRFFCRVQVVGPYQCRPIVSRDVLGRLVPFSLANGIADFIYRLPALAGPIFILEALGEEAERISTLPGSSEPR